MRYMIQFRDLVTVNTDPQRRCYDGCHFSSEQVWTDWRNLYTLRNLADAEDSVKTYKRINQNSDFRLQPVPEEPSGSVITNNRTL